MGGLCVNGRAAESSEEREGGLSVGSSSVPGLEGQDATASGRWLGDADRTEGGEARVSSPTVASSEAVEVEEMTAEQGRQMLEDAAQREFGMSWPDFYAAYCAGGFTGTDRARAAEELAFLAPFAG